MKIYCNYCNTPTHADTSCPHQLKDDSDINVIIPYEKEKL